MNGEIIWIIIGVWSIFFEILLFYFFIPEKILGGRKILNKIEEFKENSKALKGDLYDYIVFLYSVVSYSNDDLHTVDEFIYLPIVKYINSYGDEELVIVQSIEEFKNLGKNVFKYEDLGNEIVVNIDETSSKNMEINLEDGYFIDKVYTKIKLGDNTEVKKGIFRFDRHGPVTRGMIGKIVEAKLYSAKIQENLLEYLSNIKVVSGIVSELNNINTIEKNRRNTKTFLNIFGLVVIIITIVSFIFIFSKVKIMF